MSRVIGPLIAGALVAGCSTTAELMADPARFSYESAKSEAELEQCIGLALSSISTPAVIRGPESTTLTFGNPRPAVVATLKPISTGNAVEIRSQMGFAERWQRAIRECL